MAITDLTNTVWEFTSLPSYATGSNPYLGIKNINFYSNKTLYSSIAQSFEEQYEIVMSYGGASSVQVFNGLNSTPWVNNNYKTINIIGGADVADSALITFLGTYATNRTSEYLTNNSEISSIADAIRIKGNTSSSLVYPNGFITAIQNLPEGVTSIPFAMRPNAEIIKTWSDDFLVHTDKSITIPSYSTSSTTLIAAANLTAQTIDMSAYDYFLAQRCLTIPIYSATTKLKGRMEYATGSYFSEAIAIPIDDLIALNDSTKKLGSAGYSYVNGIVLYRALYWNSTSALSLYTSSAYGPQQQLQAPSAFGSTSVRPKSPSVTIRGSTSQFTSNAWNILTDIRCQYVIELYRAPKNSLNKKGFFSQSSILHAVNCATSSTHKLT